jgi:hypothetical protein
MVALSRDPGCAVAVPTGAGGGVRDGWGDRDGDGHRVARRLRRLGEVGHGVGAALLCLLSLGASPLALPKRLKKLKWGR